MRKHLAAMMLAAALGGVGLAQGVSIDLTKYTFAGAVAGPKGQTLTLNLPEVRSNWTSAVWAVMELDQPVDASACDGIKLKINTDQPRGDVGVYVALRDARGTWHYAPWVTGLSQAENVGTAWFADLSLPEHITPPAGSAGNALGLIDLSTVTALAVGSVNPQGVGKVSFSVAEVTLVAGAKPAAGNTVKVEATGKTLDINGTTMIPAGLFGSFNLKGAEKKYRMAMGRTIQGPYVERPQLGDATTWMFVNTLGDRTGASVRLNDPQWAEKSAASGKALGEAAKAAGRGVYVEYWNEPYLNWANKNRVNFNPKYYNVDEASEGAAVKIKMDGTELPYLKWTQNYQAPLWKWADEKDWRRGKDASGKIYSTFAVPYLYPRKFTDYAPETHPPLNVKDGEKYTVKPKVERKNPQTKKSEIVVGDKEVELTAFTPWYVYDTTQFSYWSGKGMVKLYTDPMIATGKAMKAVSPESVFIVGWGNRPSEDHWAGFTQLYQPAIDAAPEIVDGVCDHDYGGDATKMAANAEFITAYGMMKHKKWLYSFNTETANMADPQAFATVNEADNSGALADLSKMRWSARKLIHSLMTSPDKMRSFAWFGMGGPWFSETGEGVTMDLLRTLRGRMLEVRSSDPKVWAVASIDGSDPQNPRPEDLPAGQEWTLAVWNDVNVVKGGKPADGARQIAVSALAPAGMTLGAAMWKQVEYTNAGITIKEGKGLEQPITLLPQALLVVRAPITGTVGAPDLVRKQYFGSAVLAKVSADQPVAQTITIDAAQLQGAKRAWLRYVGEYAVEGSATVEVNGKSYELGRLAAPENAPRLRQIPVALEDLKADTKLVFKAVTGGAPYVMAACSVMVEK